LHFFWIIWHRMTMQGVKLSLLFETCHVRSSGQIISKKWRSVGGPIFSNFVWTLLIQGDAPVHHRYLQNRLRYWMMYQHIWLLLDRNCNLSLESINICRWKLRQIMNGSFRYNSVKMSKISNHIINTLRADVRYICTLILA